MIFSLCTMHALDVDPSSDLLACHAVVNGDLEESITTPSMDCQGVWVIDYDEAQMHRSQ